ncbi:MAG: DUF5331 domain-containing protein, partial [Limnospira sp.]
MAFFQEFTTALKQKWLQYYQENRDWLVLQMDLSSIPTPDGGRRPSSAMILGTINALDPDAAQLMLPFSKLNPDPEKLIEVLGLHFDPDIAIGIAGAPATAPPVPAVPDDHPDAAIESRDVVEVTPDYPLPEVEATSEPLPEELDLEAEEELDLEAEEELDLEAEEDLTTDDEMDLDLDAGDEDLTTDDEMDLDLDAGDE